MAQQLIGNETFSDEIKKSQVYYATHDGEGNRLPLFLCLCAIPLKAKLSASVPEETPDGKVHSHSAVYPVFLFLPW